MAGVLCQNLFAQNDASRRVYPLYDDGRPYWYLLEEGKKFFREGDYAAALVNFEDARNERRQTWERRERAFISLLSIHEVRRFDDALDIIERYITERNQFEAAQALAELVYYVGRDALKNSAKTALALFGMMKEYPEAEYWIGEVFRLEGEKEISLAQYRKAVNYRAEAGSPNWEIDVLYKIAELSGDTQNYNEMERTLTEILTGDALWRDAEDFVRNAMTRTLENEGIDKFLTMYRYNNSKTEKAHRLLGYYYYVSGRYKPAESHLLFAVLNANTVIIEEAIHKRYDFSFTTLDALMVEISRRPDLKKYMADVEYDKTLYYLGAALYANGKVNSARRIWAFLSAQNNAGEWARRSQTQLRAPFIEQIIETP
jgi:outer membrane protein assembly factor BamD (BamD/ComL family)